MRILSACFAALLSCLPHSQCGQSGPAVMEYLGSCDASAVAFLDGQHFVAASDEDHVLRVYRLGEPRAVRAVDVAGFLDLDRKRPEADLEGAAVAGDRVWWVGSHGRTAEGKRAPNRQRLFATRIVRDASPPGLIPEGRPYAMLLDDLLLAPSLRSVDLAGAVNRPAAADEGLNIEGLAASPDGRLWVGFRDPVPAGRALLVPLENPAEILTGGRARLGNPVLLDLGGLGVRDLVWVGDRCLVLAGPLRGGSPFRVYVWRAGGPTAEELDTRFPKRFRGEALGWHPERSPGWIFALADDSSREIDGCECRELTDPALRRFRATWLTTGLR